MDMTAVLIGMSTLLQICSQRKGGNWFATAEDDDKYLACVSPTQWSHEYCYPEDFGFRRS